MTDGNGYVELVRRAQRGEKEGRDKLAASVVAPLRSYLYRRTLDEDLSDDIVQESVIEMLRVIGQLEKPESFWPWMYKIALNRLRAHYRKTSQRRSALESRAGWWKDARAEEEQLSKLIADELQNAVITAMRGLKLRYREVVAMRCYEQRDYTEIAETIGCSEICARLLFYRAKKSLRKSLARSGFGRGALVSALVFFGRISSPSRAAAAEISITAATQNVGLAAGIIGAMTGKAAVTTIAAACAITAGAVVANREGGEVSALAERDPAAVVSPFAGAGMAGPAEMWYFFPAGSDGPVFLRRMCDQGDDRGAFCCLLQNENASYICDRAGAVRMVNAKYWREDLAVMRLPSDTPGLSRLLDAAEGRTGTSHGRSVKGSGELLVIVPVDGREAMQVVPRYDPAQEEYFLYNWPAQTRIIDQRDAAHRRGWVFFRVNGHIGEQEVSGAGMLPLVYSASTRRPAWLRIRTDDIEIMDCRFGAVISSARGRKNYTPGSFLAGLGRPWMGLHCIDIVRRDAAASGLGFQTTRIESGRYAEVSVSAGTTRAVYTIDMYTDLLKKIEFFEPDGRKTGELAFSYLETAEPASEEFAEPRIPRTGARRRKEGSRWLLELADGSLAQG
jgi:RNA polymerase sigma-70 factor (ECF subfamily)